MATAPKRGFNGGTIVILTPHPVKLSLNETGNRAGLDFALAKAAEIQSTNLLLFVI